MKSLSLITICLTLSFSVYARCIVEIFSRNGDPLGHLFQEPQCSQAMKNCKLKLASLSTPGATCEITLDIPSSHAIEDPQ